MKIFVKDLKEGDFISDQVFSIEEIQQHKTRKQSPYYRLILQDRSGEIVARIWEDDFKNCRLKNVGNGDVVKIDADVNKYEGKMQLIIKKLEKTDNYDITDLLQSSERDIDKMFTDLLDKINKIKNKDLKKLLKNIFEDEALANKYKRSPAAEKVHHDFVGGLLEHTSEMLATAEGLLKYYPEADKDLVVSGIILHDIGKIEEIVLKKTAIKKTPRGKLIGHVVLGVEIIKDKLPSDFPDDLWTKLEHIILAHQGELEYGAPIRPATIEAAIVFLVDYASSQTRQFQKAINLGEGPEPLFSEYQKWIRTQVFLG